MTQKTKQMAQNASLDYTSIVAYIHTSKTRPLFAVVRGHPLARVTPRYSFASALS